MMLENIKGELGLNVRPSVVHHIVHNRLLQLCDPSMELSGEQVRKVIQKSNIPNINREQFLNEMQSYGMIEKKKYSVTIKNQVIPIKTIKGRALELQEQGMNQEEIGKELNIDQSWVCRSLKL